MSIEAQLYRILSGKLQYEEGFLIRDPSFRIKKLGQKVYDECLEFIDDDLLTDRDIQIMLMSLGVWSSEKEKRLKDLPKLIEKGKILYFENYANAPIRNEHLNFLNIHLKEFYDLSNIRYKYQYLTPEGIASTAMWTAMIEEMYSGPNKMEALAFYHKNAINEEQIRDIAMSHEWTAYSGLSKSPTGKSPIHMTDYQRRLLSWTNVYKNVRSHPDFPGEKIMGDHIAFDGWMILTNRKESAGKAIKMQFDNLKPNTRNVFIGKSNKEEHDEVMSLNSPEAIYTVRKAYEVS